MSPTHALGRHRPPITSPSARGSAGPWRHQRAAGRPADTREICGAPCIFRVLERSPPPSGGAVGSCLGQRASTCPNGEQKWDVRCPRAGRADKQETHGGGAGTVRRQRSVCGVCAMPCAATPGRHPASSSETQTQAPRPGPRAGAHATQGAAPARHPTTGGHPEGGPQNGCSRQAQEPWGKGFQLQVCDRFVTPNKHD